jgi:hypothetical protein
VHRRPRVPAEPRCDAGGRREKNRLQSHLAPIVVSVVGRAR